VAAGYTKWFEAQPNPADPGDALTADLSRRVGTFHTHRRNEAADVSKLLGYGQGETWKNKNDNLHRMTTCRKPGFNLRTGATLIVGTKRDDDDPLCHGVNLIFDSGRNAEPEMNILLPPHSIDILIRVLQERANEARYIMGQNMVEYPRLPEKKIRKKKK
jgi:hypothetical protein